MADVTVTGVTAADMAVQALSHTYAGREGAVPALDDIEFAAAAGRFLVLVGPSGCGKSSLLMMLAGLLRPGAGTAPKPDSRSLADQWLVALRPFSRPAAPSTSDPVQTDVT